MKSSFFFSWMEKTPNCSPSELLSSKELEEDWLRPPCGYVEDDSKCHVPRSDERWLVSDSPNKKEKSRPICIDNMTYLIEICRINAFYKYMCIWIYTRVDTRTIGSRFDNCDVWSCLWQIGQHSNWNHFWNCHRRHMSFQDPCTWPHHSFELVVVFVFFVEWEMLCLEVLQTSHPRLSERSQPQCAGDTWHCGQSFRLIFRGRWDDDTQGNGLKMGWVSQKPAARRLDALWEKATADGREKPSQGGEVLRWKWCGNFPAYSPIKKG